MFRLEVACNAASSPTISRNSKCDRQDIASKMLTGPRSLCSFEIPIMIASSNMKSEPMPNNTRKNLVPKKRFLNSLLKCNIYRVAKLRGSWRFVRYESAGPSSLKHPGAETRPQSQPGAACAFSRGKSWAYGQSRESYCQIWCLRVFGHAATWPFGVVSIPSLNATPVMTLAR